MRYLAEQVLGLCLQVIRWGSAISVLFMLLSFPFLFLVGRRAGQWIALPGFWAISAVLLAAGTGSFAKAILDATEENASRGRRIGAPVLFIVLGTVFVFGGCGGFWAFTVRAIRSGS